MSSSSSSKQAFDNVTSDDLLKSVTGVLTRIPKKDLKNYFSRHCAANLEDLRHIQSDWKEFATVYDEFKKTFAARVAENEFLQRIFVQLATVSAVMGKIDPDSDEYGLYAGCALFVSFWSESLSKIFFPKCSPLCFFAMWSPFLRTLNVDWRFHGTPGVVLIALSQEVEEDETSYGLVFPGPAPSDEIDETGAATGVQGWEGKMRALNGDLRELFKYTFGLASHKLSSRQILYFNPADAEFQCHRKHKDSWAIEALPGAPVDEEFEQDETEEDTGEYKEEMIKLQSFLMQAAVNPPTESASNKPSTVNPPSEKSEPEKSASK